MLDINTFILNHFNKINVSNIQCVIYLFSFFIHKIKIKLILYHIEFEFLMYLNLLSRFVLNLL